MGNKKQIDAACARHLAKGGDLHICQKCQRAFTTATGLGQHAKRADCRVGARMDRDARATEWIKSHPEERRLHATRYVNAHPEKCKAHESVKRAIRSGVMSASPCEVCGGTYRVQGHHDDYGKPLDVKWLCQKHHRELHVEKRKSEAG